MIIKNKFKFIYLEITNYCNMDCPFCVSSKVTNRRFLDLDKINRYLTMIKEVTNTVYLHVLGEPLLHPNFNEIIELCNQHDLMVRLTTNGTLINKYDFNKLNIKKISFSLQSLIQYSDDLINEYFNNLEIFLNSIKHKLENGEMGIDFRLWNDKKNERINLFNQKITKILEEKLNINNLPNVHLSEADEFEWPNKESDDNLNKTFCLGGKTQLAVLSTGDVVLCCLDYSAQTKLGNLNENTLKEILLGNDYQNAMKAFQAGNSYFELCKKCKFRNRFN